MKGPIQISLDLRNPARCAGILIRSEGRRAFQVGFGRNGVPCAGSRFEEGCTTWAASG